MSTYRGKRLSPMAYAALSADIANGMSQKAAAAKYGVSQSFVSRRMRANYASPAPLKPCGTVAAFKRHKRNGERPCTACYQAAAAAAPKKPRALKPCGTVAAYQRHRRNGEQPCSNCTRANALYQRERRGTLPPPEPAPRWIMPSIYQESA